MDAYEKRMQLVARIAGANSGTVTRIQLLDAGLSPTTIWRWIDRGYLQRMATGVYAVGSSQIPDRGHLLAALAAYGDTTVLSHQTAAALWNLIEDDGRPIHVMVTTGTMTSRRGIALHRDRRLKDDEVTEVGGLRVTTPARLVFDLARRTRLDPMLDLTVAALRRRLLTLEDLHLQVDRQKRRKGSRELRRLVSILDPDVAKTRSWMERFFHRHWCRLGLPRYESNARIDDFEVDCLWRRQRLIVELDSHSYHSDPSQFERDRRKQADLESEGYTVLRVTYRMLTESPERTIGRIAKTLRRLS